MSARLYDYIITVANTAPFKNGNNIIGSSSGTYGTIANVDTATSNLKVKVSNAFQEFTVGENITSNHYLISNVISVQTIVNSNAAAPRFTITGGTVPKSNAELNIFVDGVYQDPGSWKYESANTALVFYDFSLPGTKTITIRRETGNTFAQSFAASNLSIGNVVSATSTTISAIRNNPFIKSKNSISQSPIVRLITFYYPGEWYPPNLNGNPAGKGAGYAWPADMPWKIAEIVGDVHSDLNYNVSYAGETYIPYPTEVDGIGTSSDGTLDRVNIRVANFDGVITAFIENPYLVGNVTSNSAQGIVNGERVYGLDPATVVGNVHFNQSIVDTFYGKTNSSWSYSRASSTGETWKNLKYDSRDFLGGVVEIKSTFANHLQYWPEHSVLEYMSSNLIEVVNSAPYRVGDRVKTSTSSTSTIVSIEQNRLIFLDNVLSNASVNQGLFILNNDYDPDAYVRDVFKVTELSALNENFAEFVLTSWLQYFKLQLPKRKFYKNTCQWEYRGEECQYPGPNGGAIPGTFPTKFANTNPITMDNEIGVTASEDECSKSYEACRLRNNTVHYGAFPGTGRQVPKQ